MKTLTTLTVLICLAASRIPAGEEVSAGGPVNDAAIRETFKARLVALREAGAFPNQAELGTQLTSRSSTRMALPPSRARTMSLPELYARMRKTVLLVGHIFKCDHCDEWHLGTASGFVLGADGMGVTSYHVLDNTGDNDFKECAAVMTSDGRVMPILEILAAREDDDVVIFRFDRNGRYPAVGIAEKQPAGTGIAVISHPSKHYFTITAGIISRYSTSCLRGHGRTAACPASHLRESLEVTADYAEGSSGGPVLDMRGNLAGVVRDTRALYHPRSGAGKGSAQMIVRSCAPASAVKALIARGVTN